MRGKVFGFSKVQVSLLRKSNPGRFHSSWVTAARAQNPGKTTKQDLKPLLEITSAEKDCCVSCLFSAKDCCHMRFSPDSFPCVRTKGPSIYSHESQHMLLFSIEFAVIWIIRLWGLSKRFCCQRKSLRRGFSNDARTCNVGFGSLFMSVEWRR